MLLLDFYPLRMFSLKMWAQKKILEELLIKILHLSYFFYIFSYKP